MFLRAIPLMILLLAQAEYAREAIALGKTRDDALYEAFNKGYALSVSGAIESAEIITEFRRAVMVVRDLAQGGQYAITERDLVIAMAPHRGRIGFIVQARLHPLNTYMKAPSYDVYVSTGAATRPVGAEKLTREPVFAMGQGGGIIGVRLTATFPRDPIAAGASPAVVVTDDQGNIIWQARIELSRFR